MRVLVTGGTGVIGEGLLPQLISAGHEVRLLTRHADRDAREWPDAVQSFEGDITEPEKIAGAAEGCDAVIHISGIVTETPPDVTFERVNVRGTGHLLDEAARAGTPRFIYVSSLGADRGASAYHESKRAGEALVRTYPGSWVIVRPGNVYGPGDDVMSLLLQMHRTLPAIPMVGVGDHPFQPIFYADCGEALAVAVEGDMTGEFDIAGDEVVTPAQIFDKFVELTGRRPLAIPVPESLAGAAARLADAAGVPFPLDESKFTMLVEHNVVDPPWRNALRRIFGVTPTPLDEGLRFLVDAQPEQQPEDGVGGLELKRFWADITGSPYDAKALMKMVRERCTDLMTVEFDAEPDAPKEIVEGVSLTAALPMRGNIQVRVAEVKPRSFTMVTLRGHPLAGIVRFETEDLSPGVRFGLTIAARPATMFDWFAMRTVGRLMQDQNWRAVVQNVIDTSGGQSAGVQSDIQTVAGEAAQKIEREIAELITRHRQRERVD